MRFTTEALFATEYDPYCHFGITEALVATLATVGIEGGLATGIAGGLEGAGIGAATSALTGGNPLTGALTGGLTGGAIGAFGPAIGSATGLGTTAGDVIAGGAAGLAGAELTGGNPLLGAATGGVGGLIAGASGGAGGSPSTAVTASPTTGTGGGTGAGSIAPASITAPGIAGGGTDLASAAAGGGGGTGAGGSAVSDSFGLNPPGVGANFLGTEFGGTSQAPVASTAPSAGGTGTANTGFAGNLSKMFSNPGVLLAGGALGADILMGNQPLPGQTQLTQAAGEAQSMGRGLSSYIFSGTLPPGAQQAVTNAVTAATAKIKSSFAALGMAGSTAEAQAVQQIHESAAAQTFQMADQLLKQGANYSQLSDQLYQTLLQTQMSQENALTGAIGTFASGLAGASLKSGA